MNRERVRESLVAIDFGGSSINLVATGEQGSCEKDFAFGRYSACREDVFRLVRAVDWDPEKVRIAVTGGKSRQLSGLQNEGISHINEMDAIGRGGLDAAGLETALVVSMGTGTAMVRSQKSAAKNYVHEHVGGTGLGGGTLLGLATLLCAVDHFGELESLAREGNRNNIDLSVEQIVGGAIGLLPADFTAANFGQVARATLGQKYGRQDIASGLMNMVGQNIARLAVVLARTHTTEKIVVIGRVIESVTMQDIFRYIGKLFGADFVFPPQARYAVAKGALHILADK